MRRRAQQKPMREAQNPAEKRIVFLQAAGGLGGIRGDILGAGQSLAKDEKVTLVAEGLIARFESKAGVEERIKGLVAGAVFEVRPGRPYTLEANMEINRFGHLVTGAGAVFHLDLMPLVYKNCPCCF